MARREEMTITKAIIKDAEISNTLKVSGTSIGSVNTLEDLSSFTTNDITESGSLDATKIVNVLNTIKNKINDIITALEGAGIFK